MTVESKAGLLQLYALHYGDPGRVNTELDRFLSDPEAAIWKAFEVKADGTLGRSQVLYDATKHVEEGWPGLPDGMAIDKQGNVFATGPGGVYVFSSAGKLLGRISTGERTANCTFGGKDGSILYITADMYLCRIQTKTVGLGH